MAQRRMISISLFDTDSFRKLPDATKTLYLYLLCAADDDGFVGSPIAIARSLGRSTKNIQLLVDKGYLIDFPSGVVVIAHWHVHNRIRKDTYTMTKFTEEFSHLKLNHDKIYEYYEPAIDGKSSGIDFCPGSFKGYDTEPIGACDPMTENSSARNGGVTNSSMQNSLDKESIEKERTSKKTISPIGDGTDGFEYFWFIYPHKVGIRSTRKAYRKVISSGIEPAILIQALMKQIKSPQWTKENGQFIPNPTTWLEQGRWEDEDTTSYGSETAGMAEEAAPVHCSTPEAINAEIMRTLRGDWKDD